MADMIERLLIGMKQVKAETWTQYEAGKIDAEKLAGIVGSVTLVEEIVAHLTPVDREALARSLQRTGRGLDFFKALMSLRSQNAAIRASTPA